MTAAPSPQPLSGLRVLVVEDYAELARSLRWALESFGCQVIGPFRDCESALAAIEQGEVQAAILDIKLRDRSSAPVARRLTRSGLPFVFITGYDDNSLLPESLRGYACLRKPVEPEVIFEALSAALADARDGA